MSDSSICFIVKDGKKMIYFCGDDFYGYYSKKTLSETLFVIMEEALAAFHEWDASDFEEDEDV